MKKLNKILAAALVSASLFSSVGAFNAFAASSVTGSLGGNACTGSVNFIDYRTGARASTSYTAPASIYVTVKVYYMVGDYECYHSASSYNNVGGTSASTHTSDTKVATRATGDHKVVLSSEATWQDYTSIA